MGEPEGVSPNPLFLFRQLQEQELRMRAAGMTAEALAAASQMADLERIQDELEAITSRPLLLAAVGKAANHAKQTSLHLAPLHGQTDVLRKLVANIGAALQHIRAAAEQFKDLPRWVCLLR